MTRKRIQREINDLKKEDLGDIDLEPTDNILVWKGVLPGPQGSVYEGGVFQVEIQLPNDYPFVLLVSLLLFLALTHIALDSFSAPKVAFKTR